MSSPVLLMCRTNLTGASAHSSKVYEDHDSRFPSRLNIVCKSAKRNYFKWAVQLYKWKEKRLELQLRTKTANENMYVWQHI